MDRQCRCVHNSVSNQTLYKPWVFYEIGVIVFCKGLCMDGTLNTQGQSFVTSYILQMLSEKQWLVDTNTWLLSKQQGIAEHCGMQ